VKSKLTGTYFPVEGSINGDTLPVGQWLATLSSTYTLLRASWSRLNSRNLERQGQIGKGGEMLLP